MTPTAIELWNDKKFIEKRIGEQVDFIWEAWSKWNRAIIDEVRYCEIYDSASIQLDKFENRLKELNSHLA